MAATEAGTLEAPLLVTRPQLQPARTVAALALLALTAFTVACWVLAPGTTGPSPASVVGAAAVAQVPLFRISASSYRDAGLKHGRLARERIRGWLATREMQSYLTYGLGRGRFAFEQLKADNSAAFPMYVEELHGIAEGAGISIDAVWCLNLINELANLMALDAVSVNASGKRCSDIYAISPKGYRHGFSLGHNDDWSDDIKPYWYFLAYSSTNSSQTQQLDFAGCAGLVYPGSLVGWSPTWNRFGVFTTQNTLTPRQQRRGGLASSFVQRHAICPSRSLADVVAALTSRSWSDAASVNIADSWGERMANVELWEGLHSVKHVTPGMGNYSHFNEFKHMTTPSGNPIDAPSAFKHDPRQARVDALPPPRSEADVVARLSDPLVFQSAATISTVVLDASTHQLSIWCGIPAVSAAPAYIWHLPSFFDSTP